MLSVLGNTLTVAWSAALSSLGKNPLRALLTACGILVGITAVTTVVTLGDGADRAVKAQVQNLGENLLTVRPRAVERSGVGQAEWEPLTDLDVRAISQELADVEEVAPVVDRLVRIVSADQNASTQAIGTTLAYFRARNYHLAAGTVWDEQAERTSARVVLLGPTTAQDLFGTEDPIGKSVRFGRHLFLVTGLLEAKGQTAFGMDQDSVCVMPIGAMRNKVLAGRRDQVGQILVKAGAESAPSGVERALTALLRQRHGTAPEDEDDFSIRGTATVQDAQQGIVDVMRTLLLSIAVLSLAIGGIGVMNIMLVGVAERTREIGTRLALGATATDIMVQFLIEAVLLSFLGGAMGAGLTFALLPALEAYFGWELVVSLRALGIASGVSVAVGVLFGILPARRAAHLDPVEALRRE